MRQLTKSITIHASKEEVWDVLFNQFGHVNNWNPLIEGSSFIQGDTGEVGCERMCQIDSKTIVHKRIARAESGQDFEIEVFEGGLPMMEKMRGRFDLVEISENQTTVEFTMYYSTKPAFVGGMMKGKMTKMFFKMLIGLKYHIETQEMVTKQNIKDIERAYNRLVENAAFAGALKMAS